MQKNIPTITTNMDNTVHVPLPSYAEAMASTSNNSSNQPASYGHGYSQMPGYPPTAPNYVHSNIPNQPSYQLQSNPIPNNPTYVSVMSQQSQQAANVSYIARTRVVQGVRIKQYGKYKRFFVGICVGVTIIVTVSAILYYIGY